LRVQDHCWDDTDFDRLELQEKYIKVIEEVKGTEIDVIRKPWGHCPNWSFPGELIDVVVAEAEK
jgi:hypothetical protein